MEEDEEICRVCRSSGTAERPLFHPCICTGSIRHVHQECLIRWLQHSRKEYCELCNHKYSFKPIYSPDMPNRLPLKDLFFGLLASIGSAVKCWIHYTFVAIAWLGVVPLTASRIYNCVFAGSVSVLTSFPGDMLSFNNIGQDIMHGCVIVACTLSAFISLLWLRIQVLHGDLPAWLIPRNIEEPVEEVNNNPNDVVEDDVVLGADGEDLENFGDEFGDENEEDAELNWNIIDWDQEADDISWERILGLDGSFLFVEHVLWVIALNTLFILVFTFCPYHLGHFFLLFVDLKSYVVATKFEGVLTTLCGYVLVACGFLSCHIVLQIAKFHWTGRLFGLCYIILKVALLVLVEIGIFPLLCGIWLDICSLKVFDSTLEERQITYLESPGVSIFLHWVIGMIFVFYFANFLMLAKEVLRPGALWFLRNLNDPDFNPINEMIQLSIYKYCRRFLMSTIIFGSTIVILAWLPVYFLCTMAPSFLPYHASMRTSLIGEFCLQVIILQFTIPGLLEHGNTKTLIKKLICKWAEFFGLLLGIKSYLLDDKEAANRGNENPLNEENAVPNANDFYSQNDHAERPFIKPPYFALRIVVLLACVAVTFGIISFGLLVVPVFIGRSALKLILDNCVSINVLGFEIEVHETYTFLLGTYFCWNCCRFYWAIATWLPRGWKTIREKITDVFTLLTKLLVIVFFLVFLLPLLIGLLVDLVILIPMTISLHQTPLIILWHDWAIGLLMQKLLIASLFVGPRNWLKENLERAYQQGLRNLPLCNFVTSTLVPVLTVVLIFLSIPYIISRSIPLIFDCQLSTVQFLKWRTYPLLIFGVNTVAFFEYEIKQFNRLCDHIKNERYLIGKRLQDYNP